MKGKSDMASIFEKMIQDFRRKDMAQLLEECMKPDVKKAKKIPLRYRLIAIVAKSPLWKKIIANVMNLKVDVIESEEGPGYGAAILAAVGCGEFENVESAVDKLVHVVETVEPDTELVEKYEKCYRKFKKYYPALKGLF